MIGIKGALAVMILFTLSLCVLGISLSAGTRAQTPELKKDRQPVIVELFTSEGCSSCPPADALLARFEDQQPVSGAEIIALEEHVDYWDQQGWIDPFSAPEWTQRQQVYVAKFKEGSVYTPEMVVGGQSQFIGSHELEAERAIAAVARQAKTDIVISATNSAGDAAQQLTVNIGRLGGSASGDTAEVWLAVTEKDLHSIVNGGENAGKNLHHAAIVRTLRKIGTADPNRYSLSFTASPIVKLKSAWKRENLRLVVFVQEKNSRRILGAASIKIAK